MGGTWDNGVVFEKLLIEFQHTTESLLRRTRTALATLNVRYAVVAEEWARRKDGKAGMVSRLSWLACWAAGGVAGWPGGVTRRVGWWPAGVGRP